MKFKHFIFLFIPVIFFSCNSGKKESDLSTAIKTVVKAFGEKDSLTLNKFIHKDYGMTVLYKHGVFDQFETIQFIDFNHPVPENFPYPDFIIDIHIKYDELPQFDCNQMKWTKTGLYCDTLNIDNLLSTTAINLKRYVHHDISDLEIKEMKEMEKNSLRVILSDIEGGELVFYLTHINNNWYLRVLDRCSSDCSS